MIGSIEAAMVNCVEAANAYSGQSNVLGYKLNKVDSYGGDFSDAIERVIRNMPAVLFAYAGFQKLKATSGGQLVQVKSSWVAYCCAFSLRNEKAARQGSGNGGVGSYQLAEDVMTLLAGQTFGLAITPITPVDMKPLINDKPGNQLVSIYGVTFETMHSFDLTKQPDSTVDPFTMLNTNWDIPPIGNVSNDLPADDTADMTSNVELPQS